MIAEANRIFGFDGWQRQTIAVRCVAQAERLIGREQKPGWGVTYTARVRVTVTAGGLAPLVREGSGAGHGIDVDLGQAHESALKEAETDAMKRALMTFGNPFGLALYDKAQRQVSSAGGQGDGPQRPGGQRSSLSRPEAGSPSAAADSPAQGRTQATASTSTPSAPADSGQVALDAETIQHLHSTLRALPRPGHSWRASPGPSASASRCPRPLPPSPIGSTRSATTTGLIPSWCRTGRCAKQISTRRAAAEALAPKRIPC